VTTAAAAGVPGAHAATRTRMHTRTRMLLAATLAAATCAAALLGSPKLLIFDESLNGLDPLAAFEVKGIIRELAATGRHAIVISTHVVETVPALCTRAIFLADGRIVEHWNTQELARASQAPGAFESCVMKALNARALHSATVA